jgi:hypothetical protein
MGIDAMKSLEDFRMMIDKIPTPALMGVRLHNFHIADHKFKSTAAL